jgi:hypothetical protein
LITGIAGVNKFGQNSAIASGATEDIWDGGSTWAPPTQARTHTIVSTDDNDGKTGAPSSTGARTLRVYGLTSWSTAETSEDITLDGTTGVVTSNSYVIIHRMKVLTKGSTNVNIGTITATATTDATVTAQIQPGLGQTEMAIYGVPSTQKFYMTSVYCDVNKSGGAAGAVDVALLINPNPDVELSSYITKFLGGLMTTGTSHFSHNYIPYNQFAGPTIIKVTATSGFNTADVSAGFDGYLVDN